MQLVLWLTMPTHSDVLAECIIGVQASLAQQSGSLNVGLLRLHNIYGPGSPYDPQRSQALPSLIRKVLLLDYRTLLLNFTHSFDCTGD